jgi:hypothetical protein
VPKAELSFQFRAEHIQFLHIISHITLLTPFDQGRGKAIPLLPSYQIRIPDGEPYGAGSGSDRAPPITPTVHDRAAATASCAAPGDKPNASAFSFYSVCASVMRVVALRLVRDRCVCADTSSM